VVKSRAKYSIGSILTGGEYWSTFNQNLDFTFLGTGTYLQQNINQVEQAYQFKGYTNTFSEYSGWNSNIGGFTNSAWNRALGKTSNSSTSNLLQSSSSKVATKFSNDSYLLGLQSINSTDRKDTNSNRPQLTTSYRVLNDNIGEDWDGGSIIPNNNTTTGNKSRTGQPYSLYSLGRPFKLKDISEVDNYHYLYRKIGKRGGTLADNLGWGYGNNGESKDVITGGVSGGSFAAGGRNVVKSLIPENSNNTYNVQFHKLSPNSTGIGYNSDFTDFIFRNSTHPKGDILGDMALDGWGWYNYNQNYSFNFRGTAYDEYVQNYKFNSTGVTNGSGSTTLWNRSNSVDMHAVGNRALGSAVKNTATTMANQSNNGSVATILNDGSYLLGFQSLNPTHARDYNSNRPQLQTSYRRGGDTFNTSIPDDNSINGTKSRTGQHLHY
jgi:hypothetical protein